MSARASDIILQLEHELGIINRSVNAIKASPPEDDDEDEDEDDQEEQDRDRRALALLALLRWGDWTEPTNDVADELGSLYASGLAQAGFRDGARTRDQARANLGLGPVPGGDEDLDIVDEWTSRAAAWGSAEAEALMRGMRERSPGMFRSTLDEILKSLKRGKFSPGDIAAAVAASAALSQKRAERAAEEAARQAARAGFRDALRETRVTDGKAWVTMGDDLVEEDCLENEAASPIPIDDEWPNGDDPHIGCFPGDVLVTAPPVKGATKRWYDGDLIVIDTAGGKQLRVTPNHPILTPQGWVAAHLLDKGDNVVGYRAAALALLGDPNGEDVPTRIQDVTEAFGRAEHVSATPVPTTSVDFHGDGRNSEVAIVWSDRLLERDVTDATQLQHRRKLSLVVADVVAENHIGLSLPDPLLQSGLATLACYMGGGNLPLSLLDGHLGPLHPLSVCSSSQGNAVLSEVIADNLSIRSESLSKPIHGHAIEVEADEGCNIQAWPARSEEIWSRSKQALVYSVFGQSEITRDLELPLPGEISLDRVLHTNRISFSGHVYNLETSSGWYVAAGLVVHNCRCHEEPADLGDEEKAAKHSGQFAALRQNDKFDRFPERLLKDLGKALTATIHTKVRRDAFLYMDPQGKPDDFAQCASCAYFLPEHQKCAVIRAAGGGAEHVEARWSCGEYAYGTPDDNQRILLASSPAEAGLVQREVRCENCRFSDGNGHCGLFASLNKSNPDFFDLDIDIDPHGCCNAQTPKDTTKAGGDHVKPENAVPVALPLADPVTEANTQHRAWEHARKAMRPGWYIQTETRTIPMSLLWATQAVVDSERVAQDSKEYAEEGQSPSELPLVLQRDEFYYILAGHHHAEAIYLDGAQQLDVTVMLAAAKSKGNA